MSAAAKEEARAFALHLHRRSGCGVIILTCPADLEDPGHFALAGVNPHQVVDAVRALLQVAIEASAEGAECCGGCADRLTRCSAALEALKVADGDLAGSVH